MHRQETPGVSDHLLSLWDIFIICKIPLSVLNARHSMNLEMIIFRNLYCVSCWIFIPLKTLSLNAFPRCPLIPNFLFFHLGKADSISCTEDIRVNHGMWNKAGSESFDYPYCWNNRYPVIDITWKQNLCPGPLCPYFRDLLLCDVDTLWTVEVFGQELISANSPSFFTFMREITLPRHSAYLVHHAFFPCTCTFQFARKQTLKVVRSMLCGQGRQVKHFVI